VLPPGETETGAWSARTNEGGGVSAPVSFTLPLTSAPTPNIVTAEDEEEETVPTGCAGGSVDDPTAKPGNLCIYEGFNYEGEATIARLFDPGTSDLETGPETGKTGAIISVTCAGLCITWGSWAVTAPE
jgi:hypothetical protein